MNDSRPVVSLSGSGTGTMAPRTRSAGCFHTNARSWRSRARTPRRRAAAQAPPAGRRCRRWRQCRRAPRLCESTPESSAPSTAPWRTSAPATAAPASTSPAARSRCRDSRAGPARRFGTASSSHGPAGGTSRRPQGGGAISTAGLGVGFIDGPRDSIVPPPRPRPGRRGSDVRIHPWAWPRARAAESDRRRRDGQPRPRPRGARRRGAPGCRPRRLLRAVPRRLPAGRPGAAARARARGGGGAARARARERRRPRSGRDAPLARRRRAPLQRGRARVRRTQRAPLQARAAQLRRLRREARVHARAAVVARRLPRHRAWACRSARTSGSPRPRSTSRARAPSC